MIMTLVTISKIMIHLRGFYIKILDNIFKYRKVRRLLLIQSMNIYVGPTLCLRHINEQNSQKYSLFF